MQLNNLNSHSIRFVAVRVVDFVAVLQADLTIGKVELANFLN
jgi:hypothetical protein